MIEIERKFLIDNTNITKLATNQYLIKQGYLSSVAERTVRIRTKDDKGYITVKGKSNESGTSRMEWEKEIPFEEALKLLSICEDYIIDKTRYLIPHGKHCFEIDVFHGANEGLLIAEIELSAEDEVFEKPIWLGEEVTGDNRYYNSFIAKKPFKNW
ncbi:CYTH domain-containing protein [Myroides guanonis]|uniref:CYTH domain-containing protein n=1 Tax=Myroides guanonis TaxID=1150112 RepID=A0A1I3MPX1_9FLAO|nr:CYTH domain-containing protein [Myroides guanonis]SFI98860.1 CYTH domain-containing protein [Myroides guanonis]